MRPRGNKSMAGWWPPKYLELLLLVVESGKSSRAPQWVCCARKRSTGTLQFVGADELAENYGSGRLVPFQLKNISRSAREGKDQMCVRVRTGMCFSHPLQKNIERRRRAHPMGRTEGSRTSRGGTTENRFQMLFGVRKRGDTRYTRRARGPHEEEQLFVTCTCAQPLSSAAVAFLL